VADREVLDLPRIALAMPNGRAAPASSPAVKSLIDPKGLGKVRLRRHLGDHGVWIEDTLIYRTAA
jgi:hypothetical protein